MAGKQLPSTLRKLIALRASPKFREIVSIKTEPMPKPGDGEVLVKNRFVGINASDINFTAGRYDPTAKFPMDTGFEAVAEVVAAGPNATYKPGQPVMYLQYGAFSDYKVVKDKFLVPLPEMKAEFLPFILSGTTASISLDKVGDIKKGETVLVTAAAGGTGQFAVQWAKLKGCHVIGTCSSEDKVQFLKELGCDRPVNYKTENLREVLKKEYPKGVDVVYESIGGEMFDTCVDSFQTLWIWHIVPQFFFERILELGCDRPVNYKTENLREVLKKEYPKGVDVVYESIGGEMFDTCVDSLAQYGRLIIIGFIQGYETEKGVVASRSLATLPARLLPKSASVRGFFLFGYAKDIPTYVMKQVQYYNEGKLKSIVDIGNKSSTGPFIGLEKIYDAVEHLYSQKSIGKIVVDLNSKL